MLTIVGSTMPAWGPHAGIPAMCDWYARYRSLRRLYPLWAALYRAQPEIALLPPPSAIQDALVFRDLGFRLYRWVVEIRDGYLLLRPYLDPDALAAATDLCAQAGLTSDTTQAIVDATSLAVALKYQARGAVPAGVAAAGHHADTGLLSIRLAAGGAGWHGGGCPRLTRQRPGFRAPSP